PAGGGARTLAGGGDRSPDELERRNARRADGGGGLWGSGRGNGRGRRDRAGGARQDRAPGARPGRPRTGRRARAAAQRTGDRPRHGLCRPPPRRGALLGSPRSGRSPRPLGRGSRPEADGVSFATLDHFDAAADPALPTLSLALDPEVAEREFSRLPRLSPGPGGRLRVEAVRVTRHKPGRRCLIEYDLEVEREGSVEALTVI